MDSKYYSLIEMSLAFGPVLAFAIWELYSLKRDKRKREASDAEKTPGKKG